eukprot:7348398-Prymnesium_polylepis.1
MAADGRHFPDTYDRTIRELSERRRACQRLTSSRAWQVLDCPMIVPGRDPGKDRALARAPLREPSDTAWDG